MGHLRGGAPAGHSPASATPERPTDTSMSCQDRRGRDLKHPLISRDSKGLGERPRLLQHLCKAIDEGPEPVLGHVGDQLVERGALAEQGMGAGLDGVGLEVAVQVLVGHIYPGMIHIADLEFSDPYSPIPEEQRQYRYTEYRGLGLLGTFVDHVVSLARELGVHEVTLTAATADHVPLFERHDFVIANSPRAKIAEKAG